MKTIIVSIVLLITINGLFNSCTSFLDEEPVDRYVVGNFYSSATDAEAAVAAVYRGLHTLYDRDIFLLIDVSSDDTKSGIGMSNMEMQEFEFMRVTPENLFNRNVWDGSYSAVYRANTAINNIPNIIMEETLKTRLIAEAKFLRALNYFNLVRFYGDVPVILDLKSLSDALGPRVPKDQVYQQIKDDLAFAENNLPIIYPSSEIGRATKGAAKVLLGMVYLTLHEYQNCVSKLAEVIEYENTYGYGLHEDFFDNWRKPTENGSEMIFTIDYMEPPGIRNNFMNVMGPKNSLVGGFAAIGLSNGNESWIPTIDLCNQYLDVDERKNYTYRTEFVSLIDGSIHTSSIPIFVKYMEENEKNTNLNDCNHHIMRYADALLMYAEALNEVGQTVKAHDYLNRVRERAFNSTAFNYSGLSQGDFRNAVWQERRLELAMEGSRWFDLVRTGTFMQVMEAHSALEAQLSESYRTEIAENIRDYMVLYPIPQLEMDLNDNLIQNPGY